MDKENMSVRSNQAPKKARAVRLFKEMRRVDAPFILDEGDNNGSNKLLEQNSLYYL